MKVSILGHLLTKKEYKRLVPFGKYIPLPILEWFFSLIPDSKKIVKVSDFDILGKADGCAVGILLTAEEVMRDRERARKLVLDAVLYSQDKLNCDLVMLGALTAPITSAGLWLKELPEVKIAITTGNTYTAAISIEAAEKAMELRGMKKEEIKMAIVGAAGVIGEAITRHFNEKGFNLLLIEREMDRFDKLITKLTGGNYALSKDISDIINSDIVITATSHPESLIVPEYLKKNAIVVDVAEPPDVVDDIEERRPDVICIDGGRVKWGDFSLGTYFGLPKGVGFACMTEGIMQALEGDKKDYIGSIDMEHLKETMNWGRKWNFPIADFTCFNKRISLDRFKK
jgi:fatty aldehyde-generating acyl-ACP reductase